MTQIGGKVAVVTGGGNGIGRGLALALAAEGASVAIADIMTKNAEAVVDEIKQAGGRAAALACDVSDRASVRAMKAEANALFGPVSLLFANAGVTAFEPLTAMSDDDIDWILQVDLFGVMHCLQIFAPDMIAARDGHIVATSSYAGLLSSYIVDHAPYVAAKAGVIGLMLTMRRELAPHGVGSTVLCPGAVASRIVDSPSYRPARFGGPAENVVTLPSAADEADRSKVLPAEMVAQMVLRAVRENRPMVVTDSVRRDMFQQGFVDLVHAAFDDAEAFEADWRGR